MSEVAAMKGYGDEVHAWAWCFWLGIFGYIYVLSLPDKVTQEQNQRIIELWKRIWRTKRMIKCPNCNMAVSEFATTCPHCGKTIDKESVTKAVETQNTSKRK